MITLLRPAEVKNFLGTDVVGDRSVIGLGYCRLEFGTFYTYPEPYLVALRDARDPVVRSQVIEFNKSHRGRGLYETIRNEWAAQVAELAANNERRSGWLMANDVALLTGATSYAVGLWRKAGRLAYESQRGFFYYSPDTLVELVKWKLPVA